MSSKKILILFAHPSQSRSDINLPLYQASRDDINSVTCVDLYEEYPNFRIDIDKEQKRLVAHDVIIFMFPMYWFSTPALLKEWQDLVLEYGFAYGHEGMALTGKQFLCAISTGGSEKSYQCDDENHSTVQELLQPLEKTAQLCGMEYLPPFVLFGARTAVEENRLTAHIELWQSVLKKLSNAELSASQFSKDDLLSHCEESLGAGEKK
jgi:glutathione-regulated potassium-efflux system ancillary protein KefG